MFFECPTCYTPFTTVKALKRHKRRYHPYTKEEQIMCKTCNMPFSDRYYLKRHISRSHRDEIPNLSIPLMKSSEDMDKTNLPTQDEIERDEVLENPQHINNVMHLNHSSTPQRSTDRVITDEAKKKAALPAAKSLLRNVQPKNIEYTEDLTDLAELQDRNTSLIKQNTLMLFNILKITKDLVKQVELNNTNQAKEAETRKHECKICNIQYKNSNSLSSHKSRYHPYKAIIDWSCKQCNLKFGDQRDLYIHNYRSHRSSL